MMMLSSRKPAAAAQTPREHSATQPQHAVALAQRDFSAWVRSLPEAGLARTRAHIDGGDLPSGLQGALLRAGPALFERGGTAANLLDADGYVVRVDLREDGSAWVSGRFVETDEFRAERAARRLLHRGSFGTRSSRWLGNYGVPRFKNAANTNTLLAGGRLLALWEGGLPYELDASSLETVGASRLGGALKRGDAFSAHPAVDAATGSFVNIAVDNAGNAKRPHRRNRVAVLEFDRSAALVSRQEVELLQPYAMLHDFKATDEFVVFLQSPLKLSLPHLLVGGGVGGALHERDGPALLYVVKRCKEAVPAGAKAPRPQLAVFHAPRIFSYHCINAFVDKGELIFDVLGTDHYVSEVRARLPRPAPCFPTASRSSRAYLLGAAAPRLLLVARRCRSSTRASRRLRWRATRSHASAARRRKTQRWPSASWSTSPPPCGTATRCGPSRAPPCSTATASPPAASRWSPSRRKAAAGRTGSRTAAT
jgi:carotenoid cleavage dioxygenase-like enzyme